EKPPAASEQRRLHQKTGYRSLHAGGYARPAGPLSERPPDPERQGANAALPPGRGRRDQVDLRGHAQPRLGGCTRPGREAPDLRPEADPADRAGAAVRRLGLALFVGALLALMWPLAALAHDQPETKQSRWVMADWMMDTFFIFSGLAVVAFLAAWKAGHFQELDRIGGIPLLVEEEDYYTPDWALDEEEWADGDA